MSIAQNQTDVKQEWVRLSNDEWVAVPEGADPASFRKWQELRIKRQNGQIKPRRKAGSRCRRNKRTNYAAQVAARGKAQAELVSRVNDETSEVETERRQAAWEAANPDMEIQEPF